MKIKSFLLLLVLALSLTGCATSNQHGEFSDITRELLHPDGTQEKSHELKRVSDVKGKAMGEAKQTFAGQRVTNTDKSTGIGITDAEQKSEASMMLKDLTELLKAARPTP